MDLTLQTILTNVIAFIFGYLSRYIEPRARLVHWFPGFFTFQVPVPNPAAGQPPTLNISTHALTIQNLGWRTANQIEIIHGQAPQLFRMQPQLNFTQTTLPNGEHVITIPTLARREWVTIQVLTVGTLPPLRVVRSHEGQSTHVTTQQTFVISRARRRVLQVLLILGLVTAIYWTWRIASRVIPPFWEFVSR